MTLEAEALGLDEGAGNRGSLLPTRAAAHQRSGDEGAGGVGQHRSHGIALRREGGICSAW